MLYRATQADIDFMAAVHAASFPVPDTWSRDVFSLQLAISGVFGVLHQSGGMILARVAADQAEILTLGVLPAAQRSGIATALLHEAVLVAAGMGSRSVFLEVSVANMAAWRIYTRAGFVEAGRRRNYYSDNSDALVLRLDVPGS